MVKGIKGNFISGGDYLKKLFCVILILISLILVGFTDINAIKSDDLEEQNDLVIVLSYDESLNPSTEEYISNSAFITNAYLSIIDLHINVPLYYANENGKAQAIVDHSDSACFFQPLWLTIDGIICDHNIQNNFSNIHDVEIGETIAYIVIGDKAIGVQCVGCDLYGQYMNGTIYDSNGLCIDQITHCDYIFYTCDELIPNGIVLTYWNVFEIK